MSGVTDPEIFAFAANLIEKHGGVVENRGEHFLALLPTPLARLLHLPDEVLLGTAELPLIYGSPVLDRLIGLAVGEVPVTCGQIEVPYIKKAGFEQLLGQDIRFTDGLARVMSRAEARTTYMVLVCHYVAMSDERKEGLVRVGVHEASGAVIENLEDLMQEFHPQFFFPGKVPSHFPVHIEKAIGCAMTEARLAVKAELEDFIQSMRRRLHRDVRNTREYYDTLRIEMEEGLSRHNLTETQRREREAKIIELPVEMDRKILDLEQKYSVKVTIRTCAAIRLLVNVAQLILNLKYRKLGRQIKAVWNPLTRGLDPLVCDRCGKTIRIICPSAESEGIALLCTGCASSKR